MTDLTDVLGVVQGRGTPGAQAGGVMTVQGDPNSTLIPVVSPAGATPNLLSLAVTTSGPYAANTCVGSLSAAGASAIITFPNMARGAGLGGLLASALLVDNGSANISATYNLFLFNDTLAGTYTDFAAFAVNSSDYAKLIGVLQFNLNVLGAPSGSGAAPVYPLGGVATKYKLAGTSMYGVLVCSTSPPTFVTSPRLLIGVGAIPE